MHVATITIFICKNSKLNVISSNPGKKYSPSPKEENLDHRIANNCRSMVNMQNRISLHIFMLQRRIINYNKESSDRLNWISLCTCYNCKYSPLPVVYLHEYLSNIESDACIYVFFLPISFFIFDQICLLYTTI